ncbi:MAG TPA: hypothetical protein VEX69_04515 [Candidatus Limnocylindria bacterium]|nr:hypothetical protein [Candidatus Limnocylindria bacterium]
MILYSGHGGLAWLLLPLCFPYIALMLAIKIRSLPAEERAREMTTALTGQLLYILVAYPLGRWSERNINSTIGMRLLPGTIFEQAIFPLGKIVPPYYTREEEENPDLYLQRHGQP